MNFSIVHRKNIDPKRWDALVEKDSKNKIYGLSWYLDAVTKGQWEAVIFGDFHAVWPLPYNRKLFGLKQVYQPVLTQQLGIYGEIPDKDILEKVLRKLKKRYVLFYQQYSPHCCPIEQSTSQKTNMELGLSQDYDQIKKGFGRGLKQNLKRAAELNIKISEQHDLSELLNLAKSELAEKAKLNTQTLEKITLLLNLGMEKGIGKLYRSESKDGTLLNLSYFFFHGKYIYNLFGASSPLGHKQYAMPWLLNHLIQEHSGSDLILDFEGSDLPGVAKFFKSFGAESYPYPTVKF